MKKLELIEQKNPLDVFKAEELNKILEAIGVSYDASVEIRHKPRRIVCGLQFLTGEMHECFEFDTSTPIELFQKTLKVGFSFENKDSVNMADIDVKVYKNQQLYGQKSASISPYESYIMPFDFGGDTFGTNTIRVDINTKSKVVMLEEIVWGW